MPCMPYTPCAQLIVLPPVEELQRRPDTRWKWVNYSAYDAKSTLDLYHALRRELQGMQAALDPCVVADYGRGGVHISTLWDVYLAFWRPFGELLTDMEAAGLAVDRCERGLSWPAGRADGRMDLLCGRLLRGTRA